MTQQELKEYIIARVFSNNAQEITGASLQDALLAIVDNSQNEEEATEALARLATDISEIEDTVAQNTADIATKQETLTLTVKDNGNIVIGNLDGQSQEFMPATPSGDPMHYMYEAVGAVWNATTGYWETARLKNITTAEMRYIYNLGNIPSYVVSPFNNENATYRTNLPRLGSANTLNWDFFSFASNNAVIEVIDLTVSKYFEGIITVSRGLEAFRRCSNLREIYGLLKIADQTTNMFAGCASLSRVKIKDLKLSISFADSPILSKESLLYMINNSASNATFTITLHPDIWAKCQESGEWHSEIKTSLTNAEKKGTTITLASA